MAAARVAHAPPPKPTRAPVPAKLVPKAAQVDAKAREIKPQPPSPPEPPPRVAEIDAPAGADPAPAGAGVDPATPAGAETAEAAVAPQQAPPPPPAPIPASTAAPTTAPPAPQPIFPAPVGSGSEPALPVTLSRSAQAEGGTVHVVLGRTDIDRGAVSTGSLREALNIPALERCYASSPAFGGSQRLQVALEITTELSGRISSAKVGGQLPAKFAHCIEEVVRFGRVRDADTGALHATIDLYFQRIGGR